MNKKYSSLLISLVVVVVIVGYFYTRGVLFHRKAGQQPEPLAAPAVTKPIAQAQVKVEAKSSPVPVAVKPDTSVLKQAESLLKAGRTEEGLKRYNEFVNKYPGHSLSNQVLTKMGALYEEKGMIDQAVKAYEKIAREYPQTESINTIKDKLGNLKFKLLFSPAEQEGCVSYEVKYGDSLAKIASQFKTTVELIKRANRLENDLIFVDQKLKVCKIVFSLLVDKSRNIMMLKVGDEVWKTYKVSTGTDNSTPTGTFKITDKLANPVWFKVGAVIPSGSPDNALGTRWLGISLKGYGIHGTTDPATLGQQITNGCVRMLNQDVEELFAIVPEGTAVTIVNRG